MRTGKIDWYNGAPSKGYGFIIPDDKSPNVFFHYSAIESNYVGPHHDLNAGDAVQFESLKGPKGPQAVKVLIKDKL